MSNEIIENNINVNYVLFQNSNEIMNAGGYGIIWIVTNVLKEFVNDSIKNNVLKMNEIETKVNSGRARKIYTFFKEENVKPNKAKEISLYCQSQFEEKKRALLVDIANEILSNRAYYMKVFGCICAYATENDKKDFHVTIDNLMSYGYMKNEKRGGYHYLEKKRFSQALENLSELQFQYISKSEKGSDIARTFHLCHIESRFFYDKGEGNNVLNSAKISLFHGLEDRDKQFRLKAFSLPIKSLKYSIRDESGYFLGFVISRKLNISAMNGNDGIRIDFQELMPFISTSKNISKPRVRQNLENKLKELEKYFDFTFTQIENGDAYFFKSHFYKIEKKKNIKKVSGAKPKTLKT